MESPLPATPAPTDGTDEMMLLVQARLAQMMRLVEGGAEPLKQAALLRAQQRAALDREN